MRHVITVTGTINPDQIQIASMHEHIPLDIAGVHEKDAFDFSVAELTRAHSLGLDTVVEVSPRRDAARIREIAELTGINVIVSTGFYAYTEDEKQFSEEQFYAHMMRELQEGIGETGIQPGVIKIAARAPALESYEVNAFRAAARAQIACGVSICTHAVTGCAAQQIVLEQAGANLEKVYFSHVEATQGWEGRNVEQEIEYLLAVVRRGSTLSYNNFGNVAHTSAETLLKIIKAMIMEGMSSRQVCTMDTIWHYDTGKRKLLWEDINPDGPNRTYSYLLTHVFPWLRNAQISDDHIREMTRDNPRRLLSVG